MRVSVTALALGLLVSLPLAVAARNRPIMRGALLGLASVVQTVPGLALLAISPKAWEFMESSRLPRYYFDLRREILWRSPGTALRLAWKALQ